MEFFDSPAAVPAGFGPSAVTIGKFDGLHAGHRGLINRLRQVADEEHLVATVVTFDRHPSSLLRPQDCPTALVSNGQKVDLLAALGVDATLMLTFDEALSKQSPEDFVRETLVAALSARVLLVGADFRFGARGAGTVSTLTELGLEHGFRVELMDEVRASDGQRASSTRIRELLGAGRVREASELLGRLPTIRSVVVHGEHRGRELGYPTANLHPSIEGFVPADGVYAAWLVTGGRRYPAAVSIGNNPTFDGVPEHQVEAHVLDENLDLYGEPVEIAFEDYIRPMAKFDGVDSLVQQLRADEASIRAILGVAY